MELTNQELSAVEKSDLEKCELIIKTGIQTFIEVGNALLKIRDDKLFRQYYDTFEDYCKSKWGFTDNYARRLIISSEVISNLKTVPMGTVLPETERQTRVLTKYEKEVQPIIWQAVTQLEKNITAKLIEEVAENYKPLNQAVKEIKSEPENKGLSEKDLLAKAEEIADKKTKEFELKNAELAEELSDAKAENKKLREEYQSFIKLKTDQINKLQSDFAKNEVKLKEAQSTLKDVNEVERLKHQGQEYLKQINKLKNEQSSLFKDSQEYSKFLEIYQNCEKKFYSDFFNLPDIASRLSPDSQKMLEDKVLKIIDTIDNWRFAMIEKCIVSPSKKPKELLPVGRGDY